MARNVSDEELQLKKRARRRLVGAIVLVTAVAVVLPMVLDSEPKPVNQNINIQIPSPDAGMLSSSPTPLKPLEGRTLPVFGPSSALGRPVCLQALSKLVVFWFTLAEDFNISKLSKIKITFFFEAFKLSSTNIGSVY